MADAKVCTAIYRFDFGKAGMKKHVFSFQLTVYQATTEAGRDCNPDRHV